MRRILTLFTLAVALGFTSCGDDYDDTDLWNAVNDHEERLAALEQWQAETNNNIAALQTLLNTHDMITSVVPVTQNGETVGYTISFLNSDPITIYNGTKGEQGEAGQDGSTPQIGLTQGDDGNWYWTLNGSLMTDTDGNPIRANGEDGKDGQDGEDGEDGADGSTGAPGRPGAAGKDAPTPQVSLGSDIKGGTIYDWDDTTPIEDPEDNAWYLSVDNGLTWYRVSGEKGEQGDKGDAGDKGDKGDTGDAGAAGEDGDSWFAAAPTRSADGLYYIFTLADDDDNPDNNPTIQVPAYQSLRILTAEEHTAGGTFKNGTAYVTPNGTATFYLSLSDGVSYQAIVAEVTPLDDDVVLTRAGTWDAVVQRTGEEITVTVTAPASGKALLDVSLVRSDGSKVTASRVLRAATVVGNDQTTISSGINILIGERTSGITLSGNDTNLILSGAKVSVSDGNAISVSDGNPTIDVTGENTVENTSQTCGAGIYVKAGSSVTITGRDRNDVLTTNGAQGGAGIGGNNQSCGNIAISNVTVYAYGSTRSTGGVYAAGIGGSGENTCGTIAIDNATVYAYGVSDGGAGNNSTPGIGGGLYSLMGTIGSYGTITIRNNSTVSVQRGSQRSDYIGSAGMTSNPASSPDGIDATVDGTSKVVKLN